MNRPDVPSLLGSRCVLIDDATPCRSLSELRRFIREARAVGWAHDADFASELFARRLGLDPAEVAVMDFEAEHAFIGWRDDDRDIRAAMRRLGAQKIK